MNIGYTAVRIADLLQRQDVVYLTDDEQQADALSALLSALIAPTRVFFVPSSDTLPGDASPASPANAGRRVAALRALRVATMRSDRDRIVCVLSGEAAARRYPAPDAFDTAQPTLRVGDPIDIGALATTLIDLGYVDDDRVDEPGEMTIRGDVVDIFPADADLPARVEVADGAIAAIRHFDPLSQRSVGDFDEIVVGRAAEPQIGDGVSILAHLASGSLGRSASADKRRRRFIELAAEAARRNNGPTDAIDEASWTDALKQWTDIDAMGPVVDVPRFVETRSPLAALAHFVEPLLDQGKAFVLAGSERDLRFLRARVAKRIGRDLEPAANWAALCALGSDRAASLVAPIDTGFVADRFVVVAAADLLGSRAVLGDSAGGGAALLAGGIAEIRVGDVVVHEDHGVGIVAGLDVDPVATEPTGEMIVLDYARGARRLVPIDEADRIWRYGGDVDAVTLDSLDGSSWQKRRGDIDAAIAATARALTDMAATRATLVAPALAPDPAAYERFVGGFPFNETADQSRAIAAMRDDLASGKPMDRLVVGDVGYGKTEVALRAVALAALAGHQAIVAAPTTVLVRQHLDSFRRRFEGTDIVVAGLSRLSTPAEKKAVKQGLADGSVNVVVGTGAVMAKGVDYHKLGLVVIDEEQRFGAADKARLRGAGDVHLLTLTATPIPRTLQMALVGLQQISIIATPPARRQPIRTSVDRYDDVRIRTALLREKTRGGQSFVVVPRIEDMATLREKLDRIVPELAFVEAHGKMRAADIDDAMVGFADGRGDILLATNIIEAGLDVPRANTMIVWRADRFGLAQLHQLRGRVGRGSRRGQVMLLTKSEDAIGERTLKRLRTLAAFDQLGAGFEISAQDLDMRGAGDLLGEEQAGHTKLIGMALYQHLLGAALRQARGEDVERWSPELHLGCAGALPERWIPSVDLRISFYVRLARIADQAALELLEEELVDRFGPLPAEAEALLDHARIRIAALTLGVRRIDGGAAAIALTPHHAFSADPDAHGLIEKGGRFLLMETTGDDDRARRVRVLLDDLAA